MFAFEGIVVVAVLVLVLFLVVGGFAMAALSTEEDAQLAPLNNSRSISCNGPKSCHGPLYTLTDVIGLSGGVC